MTVSCWNAGARTVPLPLVTIRGNADWPGIREARDSARVEPGAVVSWTLDVTIPDTATPTRPYFLRTERQGDLYVWPDGPADLLGEPFEEPLLTAESGAEVEPREVTFRFRDQTSGEVRRPLTVVPRIDVKLDLDTLVWPAGGQSARRFTVTLVHGARDTTVGTLRLVAPPGWRVSPPKPFRFTREDEARAFVFEARPPGSVRSGSFTLRAEARDGAGARYDVGVYAVDYPHVRPRAFTRTAAAAVRVAPLALPRLARVGYVRGAADRVPEALQSVGLPVTLLNGGALERSDLARYDAIVIGSRAYETEPALQRNNGRLLEYVRGGGMLLVQYQQYAFFSGGYAPYPMTVAGQALRLESSPRAGTASPARPAGPPVSHDRVADEKAAVQLLRPGDPVFRTPNRIGPDDWTGWVQERGLYFARSWDPAYRPLLETHDPGEERLEGGLLVARVGKGTYVYTGLSFFRQLPAGVPGAYRLFANLLGLAGPASR